MLILKLKSPYFLIIIPISLTHLFLIILLK